MGQTTLRTPVRVIKGRWNPLEPWSTGTLGPRSAEILTPRWVVGIVVDRGGSCGGVDRPNFGSPGPGGGRLLGWLSGGRSVGSPPGRSVEHKWVGSPSTRTPRSAAAAVQEPGHRNGFSRPRCHVDGHRIRGGSNGNIHAAHSVRHIPQSRSVEDRIRPPPPASGLGRQRVRKRVGTGFGTRGRIMDPLVQRADEVERRTVHRVGDEPISPDRS